MSQPLHITLEERPQSRLFHSALRLSPVPITAHQSWQTIGFVSLSNFPRTWELLGEQCNARRRSTVFASHVAFNQRFTLHEMNRINVGTPPWLRSLCQEVNFLGTGHDLIPD